MAEKRPDIMICISDQHGAAYTSWNQSILETPTLAQMREQGIEFTQAYTPCPLCVPARMSLMSSRLPMHTGVYDNKFTLADTIPCFTHALVEAGYETVLIGRMHFIGPNQRHGFTKRLAADITPVGWKKPIGKLLKERGRTLPAFSSGGATKLVGAGTSMVSEYDEMVVQTAVDYLNQDHEKPQFIVVGTFAPHSPYVAERSRYEKYYDRITKDAFWSDDAASFGLLQHGVLKDRVQQDVSWEVAHGCLAAYFAQIEEMDERLGALRKVWKSYAKRNGHTQVFGYVSDHGDMAGDRHIYGKQTYYDKSVRVPMILEGDELARNRTSSALVSLIDLGPTICKLAGTSFDMADGKAFDEELVPEKDGSKKTKNEETNNDRIVVSQLMDNCNGKAVASSMIRQGDYKYILYHGMENQAELYNLADDPGEKDNLCDRLPKLAKHYHDYLTELVDFDKMEAEFTYNTRASELFAAYEKETKIFDEERWGDNSEASVGALDIVAIDNIEMPKQSW